MSQGTTIGDAIAFTALVGGIFGYYYLKFREKQRYLEILHQERMTAVEKGVPLPELPIEPLFVKTEKPFDYRTLFLLGMVLFCFGAGSMATMALMPGTRPFWPAPLPVSFMGGGLLTAFFIMTRSERGY
jgi:hypothetical protein